ncbi:premnaspirodiene oxygenase-like [Quercus lobata]|uniref:Cytochrome P450 n=1 Tax=Quercus lobata TaxID=97700 RepID=A0A7N2L3H5_QUELO|nr:premnaspirodiene oxygenase-like [Quercus lobata]
MSIMFQLPSFTSIFTCFFFLLALVAYWKRNKARSAILKSPPGPWKLPLIGNLHQLITSGSLPHSSLRDLAKKHGPVMQLQLGEVSAVIISSPEAARQVLKTHELCFAQRPDFYVSEFLSYDYSGILASPYGDCWRQMRKICVLELLTAQRVHSFRSVREEEVWNLIETLSSSNGLPVNLSKNLFAMTNTVISRVAFGEKCKGQDEFISLVKEIMVLSSGFNVPDLYPSLKFVASINGMKTTLKRLYQKRDNILQDIIDDHKMNMITASTANDSSCKEDLVDVLLKLQKSSDLKIEITTKHIKAVTSEIYLAGGETAATTLEWAMSELLRNPKVIEKAQAEVRKVLEGKRKIEYTDIQKLDYVKLVVKETLRLHPPATLIPRGCRERCEINGYDIPTKTKVIVNVWALGRDPDYWVNADCFQPERFHGSSVDFKGNDFEFLPFGAGRRMCPGITFGIAIIELALAQLLYHFDWKLPNEVKPEELDMTENFGSTCRRKNDLYLNVTPRIPFLMETCSQ